PASRRADLLGRAREPPLEPTLQPVDRPAPALDHLRRTALLPAAAAARHRSAARGDGALREPALPVLDPHRADRASGSLRVGVHPPLAPPRPPRPQRALPGPQPRRDPDRLGPALRDLRAGARARRLRPDPEPGELRPAADRVPRVGGALAGR